MAFTTQGLFIAAPRLMVVLPSVSCCGSSLHPGRDGRCRVRLTGDRRRYATGGAAEPTTQLVPGMARWRGRVALVTGASSGIGRAAAAALLRHGVHVIGVSRRPEAVEADLRPVAAALPGAGDLWPMRCDVSRPAEVEALFARLHASPRPGGVDICLNNAGQYLRQRVADADTADWRRLVDVNLVGLGVCTREALASMRRRDVDDGHILNVSSTAGFTVYPEAPVYSAVKAGVHAVTEALRQELFRAGSAIRVTLLSPGAVRTRIFDETMGGRESAERYLAGRSHLSAEDVAAAVLYALAAPGHVLVQEVILRSVGQPPRLCVETGTEAEL